MGWRGRLSIKSKLIAMLLVVSSCSILATAYLGYQSGKANLTDRVLSQLTSSNSHFRVYVLEISIKKAFLSRLLNDRIRLPASRDRALFP